MGSFASRQEGGGGYHDSLNDQPEVAHLNPDQFRDLIGRGINRDLALVPFQMPRQGETNWTNLLEKKPRPTVILQNMVGIHKQSLSLVRIGGTGNSYVVSFSFDALVPLTVVIQFGRESPTNYNFPAGLDQSFTQQSSHAFDVSEFVAELSEEATPKQRSSVYPLIITLEAKRDKEEDKQPEQGSKVYVVTSYCTITRRAGDQVCSAVVSEQRISLAKKNYELLEVYGVGEETDQTAGDAVTGDENVCVICTVNPRTVTIFPCRHTYLCSECIEILRSQTNRCPICRCAVESAVDLTICDTIVSPVGLSNVPSSSSSSSSESGNEASASDVMVPPTVIEVRDAN